MGLFLEFLQVDGFIVLSLARSSVEDPRFCMIHPGNLLETPASMVGPFRAQSSSYYRRQRSCGKVMFSQVSVILSMVGGLHPWSHDPSRGG